MKLAAGIQEWSARIAECRSSGMTIKDWCETHGVATQTYYRWQKRIVDQGLQQRRLATSGQTGVLMRVQPEVLPSKMEPSKIASNSSSSITIHHGESVISIPAGSGVEVVVELVNALNRHV